MNQRFDTSNIKGRATSPEENQHGSCKVFAPELRGIWSVNLVSRAASWWMNSNLNRAGATRPSTFKGEMTMTVGLKESMKMARIAKEQEIADVITSRKDLTYEQVGEMYGVSEWTIKQLVIKLHLTGLR